MSMPLPSGRLSSLTLRNGFSALQNSSWVELALLPSPQRVTYEHAAPLWASEFPLILRNEFSALQSSPWAPLPLSHIFWVQKKKKKKGGVTTKGSVETVPQQAGAEQAVASE